MIGRLVKAGVIAVFLALLIQSLPDIKRDRDLREMSRPRAARQGRQKIWKRSLGLSSVT